MARFVRKEDKDPVKVGNESRWICMCGLSGNQLSVMARIKKQQMKKQAKSTDTILMELEVRSNKDKILPVYYYYFCNSESYPIKLSTYRICIIQNALAKLNLGLISLYYLYYTKALTIDLYTTCNCSDFWAHWKFVAITWFILKCKWVNF